jgi:dipeptidyl aminopeptidase/acylaminoacyl peptidase
MVTPDDATKRPMTVEDLYEIVEVNDPQISADRCWVAYVCIPLDRLKNNYQRNIWLVPTTGGDPIQLIRSGKVPHRAGRQMATGWPLLRHGMKSHKFTC